MLISMNFAFYVYFTIVCCAFWNKTMSRKRCYQLYSIESITALHWRRAGASTTRVLVLSKMVNMNILKTLYSSTTRVLIFQYSYSYVKYSPQPCIGDGGGWGCEVSCGGHHRPRGKTTTGSALDGAVFDIAQILAYLVHNMSRSQLYLGFGHFGGLPSIFDQ